MAAKREKEAISKLQKSKHGGNAAALSVDLREQARMRKRKLNAVATTNTMADLVIQTGMDLKNIMGLREDFADMINAQSEGALTKEKGHRKNAITLEQLSDVLFARFPDLEDGKSFRRALAVFDVDGDGYIDFDEFILALGYGLWHWRAADVFCGSQLRVFAPRSSTVWESPLRRCAHRPETDSAPSNVHRPRPTRGRTLAHQRTNLHGGRGQEGRRARGGFGADGRRIWG